MIINFGVNNNYTITAYVIVIVNYNIRIFIRNG